MPIKPFIPWVGGKTALRATLYHLFPADYTRLVEVFGGGAALIFGRKADSCEEIYNDLNGDLVNLFRCVRDRPLALLRELRFLPLNSRDEFYELRAFLQKREPERNCYLGEELELCRQYFPLLEAQELQTLLADQAAARDIRRAAAFYKVLRYSYAGGGNSFAGRPLDLRHTLDLLWACSQRLAKVVIENQSYETIIPKYDREGTLLYLDPPYYGAECYEVGFGLEDHKKLRELLGDCRCSVLLSYNDHPFIRDLYKGFWIYSVKRLNNMVQRYDPGSLYSELIISNYDPREQLKEQQLSLFGQEEEIFPCTLIQEGGFSKPQIPPRFE